MNRTELLFGMNIPDGGQVSEQEFDSWLRESVDSRLDGYTVFSGHGFWQCLREPCRLLIVVDPPLDAIEGIAASYKARFRQDAVLKLSFSCDTQLV